MPAPTHSTEAYRYDVFLSHSAKDKTVVRPLAAVRTTIPDVMSFDLEKILASKRALRRDLAARPIAEKLRMLDALRERALTLRAASGPADTNTLRENPTPHRTKPT